MALNNVILMGRLTSAPEQKSTERGMVITEIGIAVDRNRDETDFFNVRAFEKTGEFIRNHFSKGDMIAIVGRLRQDRWERDGKKYSAVTIIAERATFTGEKVKKQPEAAPIPEAYTGQQAASFEEVSSGEDLPF